jgi:hypothetical protein
VAEFTIARETFEKLWTRLKTSGATNFQSTSRNPNGKKYYAFSIGELPTGIHTIFHVPKANAPPAVMDLDREFRAIIKALGAPASR